MNNIQAAPSRVRPPREGQSKGQWAVDGKTPLNHNEEFKAEENPLAVRQRIIDVYSQQGIDSVPEDDLHGRFRWLGIYTQRKPGIDARSTSKLDAGQLSDKYFMMRIRIDGQQLNLDQVRVLGSIGTDFARDTADISDRQNVQYHWIAIEDVPEIWRRLESVGLSTTEACGDTPRGFLMSPVAGVSADEIIDPTPTDPRDRERYIGNPQFSNLPRKFKTAITGHPSPGRGARDQRHLLRRRRSPRVGRRLRPVGRRRAVHHAPPRRAPGRLRPRGGGRRGVGRRLRHLPRLRLPQAAHQGAPEVPARRLGSSRSSARSSRTSTWAASCPTAPPRPSDRGESDHVGVRHQKDGRNTSASPRRWAGCPAPS